MCPAEGFNGLEEHGDADAQRFTTVTPAHTPVATTQVAAPLHVYALSDQMRKSKRLLSVHPLDFDPDDFFPHSRRPSVQVRQGFSAHTPTVGQLPG